MRLKSFFAIVAFTAPFSAAVAPAQAQDASFGCKVLLCAAAVSPSWSGIPYCVPVMTQLFRQLARGGSWPNCAEGGANSGLGYEPYHACPGGTFAYTATSGGGDRATYGAWTQDPNGEFCADPVQLSQNTGSDCNSDNCPITTRPSYTPSPRPRRDDPYYVDLTPTGQATSRFYFSLRGY